MQQRPEMRGFGNKPFSNKHDDIRDRVGECIEEEFDFSNAVREFGNLLSKNDYDEGNFDWDAIFDSIQPEYIVDIKFWQQVLQKHLKQLTYGYPNITPFLEKLPPFIIQDVEIQQLILDIPGIDILAIPLSVWILFDKDIVAQKWVRFNSHKKISKFPWPLYSSEEKKKYFQMFLGYCPQFVIHDFFEKDIYKELQDAFSPDEWIQLWKGVLLMESLLQVFLEQYPETLLKIFSKEQLRKIILENNTSTGEKLLFSLSMPTLREYEFEDEDIVEWKNDVAQPEHPMQRGFRDFEKMTEDEQEYMLALLPERILNLSEDIHDFIKKDLPRLIKKVPPATVFDLLGKLDYLISNKKVLLPLKERCEILYKGILDAQSASASIILWNLEQVVDCFDAGVSPLVNIMCPDRQSAKVFREMMIKTGARFGDFFSFYLSVRFSKAIEDLDGLKNIEGRPLSDDTIFLDFIDAKLPWSAPLFKEFEKNISAGAPIQDVITELRKQIEEKIHLIQHGEWSDEFLDDYHMGLLTHVFPPALGVNRDQYRFLIQKRKDRQDDIPPEWDTLQHHEISFSLGSWKEKPGEVFDPKPWDMMVRVFSTVNQKRIIREEREEQSSEEMVMGPKNIIELGTLFVEILKENTANNRITALTQGYALFLARGGSPLPNAVTGREEASRLFEWSKDSFRDVVDVALAAYRDSNPTGFEQNIKAIFKKDLSAKAKKESVRAIIGIMKNTRLSDADKESKMKKVFAGVGVECSREMLFQLWEVGEDIQDPVELEQSVFRLFDASVELVDDALRQSGKISSMITQKIFSTDGPAMQKELNKWIFVEEDHGGEKRTLQFSITKRKIHSVAGLNMGVCVAVDDKLWEKEDFSNVVLFGDDGIARGGMHFEIIRDGNGGKKYLTLPGINPSLSILREVDSKKLLHEMLEFAKRSARAIGADAVLIPKNPHIHSNREDLHGVIAGMDLPEFSLSYNHQFSYSPFSYSWQDAFVVRL